MNVNTNAYKENNYLQYIAKPNLFSKLNIASESKNYKEITSQEIKRPSETAIKEAIAEIKKYYMDRSRGPNIFHALLIPADILHGYKSLVKAKQSKNKLAISDSKIKLLTTAINSTYIVTSIISIVTELGILFSYAAPTLAKVSPITGIVATTGAGIIECRNIRRQIRFISKCTKDLNLLNSNLTNEKRIFFLEKYLGNAAGIQMDTLAKLTNRVSPWFAEKVALTLPKLLDDIKQNKNLTLQQESTIKAIDLLKNTKIQAQKKLRAQSLTLLASALVISGFACIFFGMPLLIPAALFLASLVIGIANHILYNGTNKHIGWGFKLRECTPVWIQAIQDKAREVSFKPSSI